MQTGTIQLQEGTVKWFDDKKGYGYIETGTGDLFFHHSGVNKAAGYPLVKGELVSYRETLGERGPKAVQVTRI